MPPLHPSGRALTYGGIVPFGALLIAFSILSGLGQPEGYRYSIGSTQVFEITEGMVIFVAMDLVTYRPGLLQSPRVVHSPVRLYRFDVGCDGTFKRQVLRCLAGKRYHLSFQPILKLAEGLYLLEEPSSGHPSVQLHRILGQRIEALSTEETGSVLGSFGYKGGGSRETDRVTEQNGWRLLDRSRDKLIPPAEEIISRRHQLRLRFATDDTAESMIAESVGERERWAVTLLTVRSQQWRSYQRPSVSLEPE